MSELFCISHYSLLTLFSIKVLCTIDSFTILLLLSLPHDFLLWSLIATAGEEGLTDSIVIFTNAEFLPALNPDGETNQTIFDSILRSHRAIQVFNVCITYAAMPTSSYPLAVTVLMSSAIISPTKTAFGMPCGYGPVKTSQMSPVSGTAKGL